MTKPITQRPIDMLYLTFFIIHIPIILAVDITPFYPASMKPTWMTDLRTWYIATYKDTSFISPSPWFTTFCALEAVYHLPISLWLVPAILRDDALVPLHLVIWSVETAVSTLVCCAEAYGHAGYSADDLKGLAGLYVPYLILAVITGVDCFFRVKKQILGGESTKAKVL